MTLLAFIAPATARNIVLIVVGGCYLGYHLYHAWRWWAGKKKVRGEGEQRNFPTGSEGMVGASVPPAHNQAAADPAQVDDCDHARRMTLSTVQHAEEAIIHRSPSTFTSPPPSTFTPPRPIQQPNNPTIQQFSDLSGEELYAQARALPHQPIPDCELDGEYLGLLVKSAEQNYPKALAKLGDYALRRGCLVEAYYWLWRAKRAGMPNLERTLLQVRSAWVGEDFPREDENEYGAFTLEQGSVGYALLCIDTRHDAVGAKAFLSECAPDFLD